MTSTDVHAVAADREVSRWLELFTAALRAGDAVSLWELFVADAYWRDLLALTRSVQTHYGRDQLMPRLLRAEGELGPVELAAAGPARDVTRAGTPCTEVLCTLRTAVGTGRAVLRLVETAEGVRAWSLGTALQSIAGHEERSGMHRPMGYEYSRSFSGPNWRERRELERQYADREPTVLVVGAGQAGLATAARLGAHAVDALVVDRHPRVGDNWRTRYHSLTLHNETWVNHLPYLPFPQTWPTYIPKDMLADWFEFYAGAMSLNVWTSTDFLGADYDERAGQWTTRLRTADGSERVIRPRHIVMATGASGPPKIPVYPGAADFCGEIIHSGSFTDGAAYAGRRAVVFGTGTSGHDVAQDLHENGADVSIVQRGPTLVSNVGPEYAGRIYALYDEPLSPEDCDLITAVNPFPVTRWGQQLITREVAGREHQLIDDLVARGFDFYLGPDRSGWQVLYLTRGGGYYLNVGCSELIAAGAIDLLDDVDIDRLDRDGLVMTDGSHRPAELVVFATGYENQDVTVRRLFGDPVADRVGPIWGLSDELELRNMWCRTGQPGLWFIEGSLAQARIYSHYLALQILAREAGVVPPGLEAPSHGGLPRPSDLVDVDDREPLR